MYCIYLVQCSDNSYYCGITTDIARRVSQHNSGVGAKYTRARLPVSLLYSTENKFTRSEALKLEYQVKSQKRSNKLSFIEEINNGPSR